MEEVWRGYSVRRGSEGPEQLPLGAALPRGWGFVPAGPRARGGTRQLWQHAYTLFTRPREVLLGLEYGQQVVLCLRLSLVLLEKQNCRDSVCVVPCKSQTVRGLHAEKQFTILFLCMVCVLETVKPLSCSDRRLAYLQRERNCRWFSNKLADAKS